MRIITVSDQWPPSEAWEQGLTHVVRFIWIVEKAHIHIFILIFHLSNNRVSFL